MKKVVHPRRRRCAALLPNTATTLWMKGCGRSDGRAAAGLLSKRGALTHHRVVGWLATKTPPMKVT